MHHSKNNILGKWLSYLQAAGLFLCHVMFIRLISLLIFVIFILSTSFVFDNFIIILPLPLSPVVAEARGIAD